MAQNMYTIHSVTYIIIIIMAVVRGKMSLAPALPLTGSKHFAAK